jgi:hypothetical protein
MAYIAIIALSVVAAVVYGIVHDQVTARICIEYFTIGHPPVYGIESPTELGLYWGVVATWWAGLLIGIPLAISARAGTRPPRSVGSLFQPMLALLLAMVGLALVAGVMGWILAKSGAVFLVGPIAQAVPRDRHVAFLTDLWTHIASYAGGFIGGVWMCIRVWRSRSLPTD